MCEQIMTEAEQIVWLKKEMKNLAMANGKSNKKLSAYYGVLLKMYEIRAMQKHEKYETECPDDVKKEYNKNLLELTDELMVIFKKTGD